MVRRPRREGRLIESVAWTAAGRMKKKRQQSRHQTMSVARGKSDGMVLARRDRDPSWRWWKVRRRIDSSAPQGHVYTYVGMVGMPCRAPIMAANLERFRNHERARSPRFRRAGRELAPACVRGMTCAFRVDGEEDRRAGLDFRPFSLPVVFGTTAHITPRGGTGCGIRRPAAVRHGPYCQA